MMKKPKVLGRYVYLDIPERPEYKIEVDANTKAELDKEWIAKFNKLQVWAKGNLVSEYINEGDWILMDPSGIPTLKMVPMPDGTKKGYVQDHYIVHIWPD